jgi:YD repeat-containing protein
MEIEMSICPPALIVRLKWCALAFLILFSAFPAHAQCTPDLQLTQTSEHGAGTLTVTASGSTCQISPYVEIYAALDNVNWYLVANCQAATCSWGPIGYGYMCDLGTHTISASAKCRVTNATGCQMADSAVTSKSYTITGAAQTTSIDMWKDSSGSWVGDVFSHTMGVPPGSPAGPSLCENYFPTTKTGTMSAISCYPLNPGDTSSHLGFAPGKIVKETTVGCQNRLSGPAVAATPGLDNSCSISCPDCVGGPIRVSSGNMRYTEVDPLPQSSRSGFSRTYDSSMRATSNLFGNGWFSGLDTWLNPVSDSDGQWAVIRTPSDDFVIFWLVGAGYRQMYPQTLTPAMLTYDSATGTYRFRQYHSDEEIAYNGTSRSVTSIRSISSGRAATISYDGGGFPQAVTDSWGNWGWTVSTNPTSHRVDSIAVDGTSTVWNYNYDTGGNLTSVSLNGSTPWRTYAYSNNELTTVTDAAGNLIESHDYDSNGRATSSIASTDSVQSISYGASGRVTDETITQTTYASGRNSKHYVRYRGGREVTVEVQGGCPSCSTRDAVYGYDNNGNLLRLQDTRGYITVRQYDPTGLPGLRVEQTAYRPSSCDPANDPNQCRLTPDNILTTDLVPTAASHTTTYEYADVNWPDRPTLITTDSAYSSGQSRREDFQYDAATGTVVYHRDRGWTGSPVAEQERITTTALYNGTESAVFTPGGTFDTAWLALPQPSGLPKSTDGPRTDVSDVTQLVYYPIDSSVPTTSRGRFAAVRNALGQITRYENYDVFGNAGRVTDSNGVVRDLVFDALGRSLSSTLRGVSGCDTTADPLCNTDITSAQVYSPTTGPLTSTAQPNGGVTLYEYDTSGRTAAVSRGPSATDLRERMEYTYDSGSGLKTLERTLARVGTSWVEKRRESFAYDTFSELTSTTHVDNTSVAYTYDLGGNLKTVRDENHTSANTTYQYDPANRLTAVTQTLSSAPGGTLTTSYGYDIGGNLVSVTDPNGNVTTYVYDDFGAMLSQSSPVTGTTSYGYDLGGNLVSQTDANGASTSRTYDAANRLVSAAATRNSITESTTWTFDGSAPFGTGRLASMTDPSGSTMYAYDRRGLLVSEVKNVGGTNYTSSFHYDLDGNRTAMTYPSGRVVSYTFDFADRPYSATTGGTTLVSSASYLPFGPSSQIDFGNGTSRMMTYDSRYRPTENKLTGPAGVIADYVYAEDAAGNITQIHDATDSSYNRDFGYDDVNRLVTANTGSALWGTGAYQYDPMGNLLNLSLGNLRSASFSFVGTTPKIATAVESGSSRNVAYDAAGNESAVGASSFDYSPRNQLAAGEGVSYTYDGRGVRTIATYDTSGVSVASVSITPATVLGGDAASGTLTLSGPAPMGGATVLLVSDNGLVANAPASVVIPAGSSSATFSVTTFNRQTPMTVSLHATYRGSTSTGSITVQHIPLLASLVLSATSVTAGTSVTGTVTLDAPASTGGTAVTLSSSNTSAATVPSSVTIPAGSTSTTFTVTTLSVLSNDNSTITATSGATASVILTIYANPPQVSSLAISPTSVVGGITNPAATLTLSGPALTGGAAVTLASSNTTAATVPTTLTIPAGTTSGTFAVTTSTVGSATPVSITATFGATVSTGMTVSSCSTWVADPATILPDTVWFDDATPPGASTPSGWFWDTSQKASGSKSLTINAPAAGLQQGGLGSATQGMTLATAGDLIVTYVLLDPCNPPREIMLSWDSASWEHRAYWGENLITFGTDGTVSRHYMGPLPPVGQWVRLEVPAGAVGLARHTVTGTALGFYNGRVWYDRIGKVSCTIPIAAAPSSFPSSDAVWSDDAAPTGASLIGTWTWDTAQKASGTQSHTEPRADGTHQHLFTGATQTLTIATGEKLFGYVLLNPCDPPDEVMLGWWDGSSWEHRGYWGANSITYGTDATDSRRRIGDLPATRQWVRLEVAASQVGLEGKTISGVHFTLYNGQAWFDRVGKAPAGMAALEPASPNQLASSGAAVPMRARMWRWVRTRIIRRPAPPVSSQPPPVSLGITAMYIDAPAGTTTVGTAQKYFFYTPELQLASETDRSITPTIAYDYVWFGGEPIAQIESATAQVHWYFDDHLGTPVFTTNASASVDWRVEREAYGGQFLRAAGDRHQPLQFPGQELDELAPEREYNIFRWYRQGWGRYSQADPITDNPLRNRLIARSPEQSGEIVTSTAIRDRVGLSRLNPQDVAAGTEPYAYGSNSPLRFVDPLGLFPCVVHSVSSKSEYLQDIEGPPGKTFKGCQYIGVCGPPDIQYLVHYQRSAPGGCPCKPLCIFSIDLAKGVKNGQAKCIE